MFSAIRKRIHFTPATVIATLALVFAMTGGAYAASKVLITSTKQISPKVLKSLQGKAGLAGKNGVNGANGAQGPAGPTGAGGPQGAAGNAGTNGTNGESVVNTELKPNSAKGAACKEGGAEFKVGAGTGTHACNGSPWVLGGLPKGATETGVVVISAHRKHNEYNVGAISFAVPLKEPLESANVHLVKASEQPLASGPCAGGTAYEPKAESGNLCVYEEISINPGTLVIGSGFIPPATGAGAAKSGAILLSETAFTAPEEEGEVLFLGHWAVTG